MQNMGIWDWAIILVIVLVLFGGKRLPELARSLGRSLAEFKKGIKQGEEDLHRSVDDKSKSDEPKKPQ